MSDEERQALQPFFDRLLDRPEREQILGYIIDFLRWGYEGVKHEMSFAEFMVRLGELR